MLNTKCWCSHSFVRSCSNMLSPSNKAKRVKQRNVVKL